MTAQKWMLSAAVVAAVAMLAAVPGDAHAQASSSSAATRALLGVPDGGSGFVNVHTGAQTMVSPAERALLGSSSGAYVTLEAAPERSRRSAGESALLGR